jgi:hypothetical protein
MEVNLTKRVIFGPDGEVKEVKTPATVRGQTVIATITREEGEKGGFTLCLPFPSLTKAATLAEFEGILDAATLAKCHSKESWMRPPWRSARGHSKTMRSDSASSASGKSSRGTPSCSWREKRQDRAEKSVPTGISPVGTFFVYS